MFILLILLQTLGVILLGVVSFLRGTRHNDGVFTRLGWVIWTLGALLLVGSTLVKEHQTTNHEIYLRNQMDEIRNNLFRQSLHIVMETPKGQKIVPSQAMSEEVEILSPYNGTEVQARHDVKGQVPKGFQNVWVIVHPTNTSSYWVQPSILVSKQGHWSVKVYFGRSGNIDVGKTFEILAVVNPKKKLVEGEYFDRWPDAEHRSDIFTVVRQ